MKGEDIVGWAITGIVVLVIMFSVGVWVGHGEAKILRQEAVEAGVGHYVCDPDTGVGWFEFIAPDEARIAAVEATAKEEEKK